MTSSSCSKRSCDQAALGTSRALALLWWGPRLRNTPTFNLKGVVGELHALGDSGFTVDVATVSQRRRAWVTRTPVQLGPASGEHDCDGRSVSNFDVGKKAQQNCKISRLQGTCLTAELWT